MPEMRTKAIMSQIAKGSPKIHTNVYQGIWVLMQKLHSFWRTHIDSINASLLPASANEQNAAIKAFEMVE